MSRSFGAATCPPGAFIARLRWGVLAVLLSVLTTMAVAATTRTTAQAAAGTDSLYPGQTLTAGQHLRSSDGSRDLAMQGDGNLVLYWRGRAIWSTGTYGRGATWLVLQGDGNLVVYTTAGVPVWSSGSWGASPSRLVLQSDGNLVLYTSDGGARWASQSWAPRWSDGDAIASPNGQYKAVMQADGNFVFYGPSGALWSTNTYGTANAYLILQGDGNLVIYSNAGAIWNSGTWRSGQLSLTPTDAGQLSLVTPGGSVAWSVPQTLADMAISQLLALFNNYRASLGLAQETTSAELTGYAASCAAGMAAANAPLAHCRTNEIIEYNTVGTADAWFSAWLNSPPHKQLIEYPSNRYVGAAVAYNAASGRYYVVMNFA